MKKNIAYFRILRKGKINRLMNKPSHAHSVNPHQPIEQIQNIVMLY